MKEKRLRARTTAKQVKEPGSGNDRLPGEVGAENVREVRLIGGQGPDDKRPDIPQ